MAFLILLGAAAFFGYRLTTSDDRRRYLQLAIAAARNAKENATRGRPEGDAFRAALRERTPRASATLAIAALMAIGTFAAGVDGWANLGVKTTNGEWWRLVTAIFVQPGIFELLFNIVIVIQVGFLLERLIGHAAFAAVFIVSGLLANLVHVSAQPLIAGAGSSGALFGLYGLLAASLAWSLRQESNVTIPRPTLNTIAVWFAFFALVSLAVGSLAASAKLTGFMVGAACGAFLSRSVSEQEPPPQHVTIVAGVSLVLAFVLAVQLRGISDVRPEIERVVGIEDRTTKAYEAAVAQFKKGRMTADALAQVVDKTIVPELLAADARLKTYKKVPAEHQPLVADAEEYLRLRSESWRLRAIAIRKTNAMPRRDPQKPTSDAAWRMNAEARHRSNMLTLGNAEVAERTSLEAYQKIKVRPTT